MRSKSEVWPAVVLFAACAPEVPSTDVVGEAEGDARSAGADSPERELFDPDVPWSSFDQGLYRHLDPAPIGVRGVAAVWSRMNAGATLATTQERFDTAYRPMRVALADDWNLCVLGRHADGSVVLERWVFEPRAADGSPAPCVDDRANWKLPVRSRIDVVWREAAGGPRGGARELLAGMRTPLRALVFFDRSRELVVFDLDTHSERVLATPSTLPVLTEPYRELLARETELGDLYVLVRHRSVQESVWPFPVVMLDADRDGYPESVTAPTESEWESAGWGRWAPPIALEE